MPANSSNKSIIYPSGTTAARPTSVNNGFIYFNTTIGALQIYQNGSWYVLTNINAPGTPTSVTATNQGTGRGFNNGQASVAFTPATETFGFPATYTITPSPTTSPATFTGTSSPIVVTGLASSTQYTYTATATNNTGTSSASSASSGVTATTVPQAPTIGTATGASQSASLTFTAGSTGGSAITNYKYSTDGTTYTAFSPEQTTSPLTISGLTDGTTYSFYLKAINSNGDSLASSVSNSIIPVSGPSVQNYFERIYNGTKTGVISRGVRDSDGNCYFIVSDYSNGTNGYYATAVFKTDNLGAVQWSKYWTNQGYNFDIGIDSNGNLYIGTQESNRLTAYIKMNKTTGAQMGSGVYYNVGVTYRGGVAIDTDGNIWGAGSINPNNNLTGLHKVPSNLTSSMNVYGLSATYFDGIVALPNGDVVSLGTSPASNYYPILLSANKSGTFNWAKTWGNAYSSGGYTTLATDSSSNIYVGCWIADSGQTGAYGFVMKFNSSGTLQWQKKIDVNTSTGQYIYGIACDSNGNVYAVGQDSGSPVKGIIIKFNSSGTVQWQRSLTNSELSSVTVLSTGELLITGKWLNLASGGASQPLAIRIPADGSKTGSYTIGGTSVTYAASSFTISDASFTINTYTSGWANTSSYGANSYTPTINDYGATQQVVTI